MNPRRRRHQRRARKVRRWRDAFAAELRRTIRETHRAAMAIVDAATPFRSPAAWQAIVNEVIDRWSAEGRLVPGPAPTVHFDAATGTLSGEFPDVERALHGVILTVHQVMGSSNVAAAGAQAEAHRGLIERDSGR